MNSTADDIWYILRHDTLGLLASLTASEVRRLALTEYWLHVGEEPDRKAISPNVVTIYDTGGIELTDRLAIDTNTIQFRSRNTSYFDGYRILQSIRTYLEAKESVAMHSIVSSSNPNTLYVGFWVIGGITFIGKDENDLFLWTLNFRIAREPSKSESGNRLTLRI